VTASVLPLVFQSDGALHGGYFRVADHTLGGNGTTSTHSPDAVKAPGVAVSWRLLHASGQGMSHPRKVWPP
jgi:hypothetical protein